jgi:hypothetical protein
MTIFQGYNRIITAEPRRFPLSDLFGGVQVREANRQGLFTQLEAFDNRYLQKFFVGDGDDGDDEDEPQVPRIFSPSPFEPFCLMA